MANDTQPKKEVIRLAGFIFICDGNVDGTKFFRKAKRNILVQSPNDPLAEAKEYWAQHGQLKQFMKSLEPENRQVAGLL
jgi:hypothetical protein